MFARPRKRWSTRIGGIQLAKLISPEGFEGERLDRFELIAELASGGMATVYLARLVGVAGFQRMVAIKRLHPHLAKENDFVEMFLDEARLAARIHHPNVVPILEIGHSPAGYYLVMEYIEGDTLARLIARAIRAQKRIPQDVAIRIVLDALAGLHAAHELTDDEGNDLRLVHRDVSPQNILVSVDGSARLTDFGVARANSRLATTQSGQLKGKLAYMSPEQAFGKSDIDRRTDVFAMATVLWEALSCQRLFKGEGEAETLNRVLYEPIPSLVSVMPEIAPAIDAVVMKALDRDRTKRFETAADFADALERAARPIAAIGSTRDVASCLDSMMGADISEQRGAVRAWIGRSDPQRARESSMPKRAREHSEEASTRVERTPLTNAPRPLTSVSVPGVASSENSVANAARASEVASRATTRSTVAMSIAAVATIAACAAIWSSSTRARGRNDEGAADRGANASPNVVAIASSAATATPHEEPKPIASAVSSVAPPSASTAHEAKPPAALVSAQNARPPSVHSKPSTPQSQAPAKTPAVDDISVNPYR